MATKKKLGEVLVEAGIINDMQLSVALQIQKTWGGKLASTLVRMGFAREDELLSILSKQMGFPAVDFSTVKISPKTVRALPVRLAEKFNVFPVAIREAHGKKQLVLVMSDPTNIEVIGEIEFQTGYSVYPAVSTESAITHAVDYYYHNNKQGSGNVRPTSVKLSEVTKEDEMVIIEREDAVYDSSIPFDNLKADEVLRLLVKILMKKGVITKADITTELRKKKLG